jgi:hypothetical protein
MLQKHRIRNKTQLPDLVQLDIKAEKQETVQWCWAAVACGVARFLKVENQPTESDLANILTGRTDCTSRPVPNACISAATPKQVIDVYETIGINRVGPDLPLNINTLLNELVCGHPVEIGYMWYEGGGHVALVTGFRKWTSKFIISDPWFGDGELSYQELAEGYGIGRWFVSYGRFSKR